MAFITNGLTDNGSGPGVTPHFAFVYDDALDSTVHPGQPEPARTNSLIGVCESDYALMASWFGNIGLTLSEPIPTQVANAGGGASWGPPLTLDPGNGDLTLMRYLMFAEVTEMFMLAQNRGWFAADGSNEQSSGEGLSHFLATQFLLINGLDPFNDISNLWMNSTRDDFINHVDEYDHSSGPKSACALLFLYYLQVQLGFDIPSIVAAASPELAGVYQNLTGDSSDPFPFFKQLLDNAYPGTSTITTGPNLDNPFPVAMMSFWVDKSTFGRDEVQDVIASNGGRFQDAFWLVIEGFNLDTFTSLSVTIPAPTGPFANIPGITITRSATPIDFEDPGNPKVPQRIRIAYDVIFNNASLAAFPAPGDPAQTYQLNAHATASGNSLRGSNAATIFELVGGADPYFTNVDPTQNNVFYLSQDLRVFTATPGQNNVPVPGGPAFGSDSTSGAFDYIQQLLTHLNSNFSNPSGPDPFRTVLPSQGGALTGDSSVTPFTVDLSNIFNPQIFANYNFAVARVRLRGTPGPTPNVKVFFRMWSTQTADTDFQPSSTYPSALDASGFPASPQVGTDHHTIPFFATGNIGSNTDYNAGGVNNRTVEITSGDSVWAYYGCFLNIYDGSNQLDGQPIQRWLAGDHHCIVAQIAFDGAPILNSGGTTVSPENSDKLAQRNLQITHSDNPGEPATHRVPQTFDIRPSAAVYQLPGTLLNYPDELMIDWGGVPEGSIASIFWPQVDASQVLQLANELYGSHLLTASDPNTIQCKVTKGVTYVPIPPGTGQNYAGLFTVDLPTTVVKGQEFSVVVRRIATRRSREEPGFERPNVLTKFNTKGAKGKSKKGEIEVAENAEQLAAQVKINRNWRYVVGTFQVKIPVATAEVMLLPLENSLAIFKWRLLQVPKTDRWYRVLERYIEDLSKKIDGLGGDSNSIQPSVTGIPLPTKGEGGGPEPCEEKYEEICDVTGKIVGIVYDRFGDFEGFSMITEHGHARHFRGRESDMEMIIRRAWQERTLVTVTLDHHNHHWPRSVILRATPRKHGD